MQGRGGGTLALHSTLLTSFLQVAFSFVPRWQICSRVASRNHCNCSSISCSCWKVFSVQGFQNTSLMVNYLHNIPFHKLQKSWNPESHSLLSSSADSLSQHLCQISAKCWHPFPECSEEFQGKSKNKLPKVSCLI